MSSDRSKKPHVPLLSIRGRLDGITSPQIQEKINSLFDEGAVNIILDFSAVEYISSAGIRILLQSYHKAHKQHGVIALTGVAHETEQVLFVTGFLPYFKLFVSNEDAFAFFKKEEA